MLFQKDACEGRDQKLTSSGITLFRHGQQVYWGGEGFGQVFVYSNVVALLQCDPSAWQEHRHVVCLHTALTLSPELLSA